MRCSETMCTSGGSISAASVAWRRHRTVSRRESLTHFDDRRFPTPIEKGPRRIGRGLLGHVVLSKNFGHELRKCSVILQRLEQHQAGFVDAEIPPLLQVKNDSLAVQ